MKNILKIISILVLFVAFSIQTEAQNSTTYDKQLGYNQTFIYFTGAAGDTLGIADSTWSYTINKYNDDQVSCEYYLNIDSVAGSGAIDIYLEGKVFLEQTYTRLDTVTWTMTTSDTTISVKEPASDYQFWRVDIVAGADERKAEIEELNFKFLK